MYDWSTIETRLDDVSCWPIVAGRVLAITYSSELI